MSVAFTPPKDFQSEEFGLPNGHGVKFNLKDGKWNAYLFESFGVYTRVTSLPVVCEGNQDTTSVLETLLKQSRSYVVSRVHIMDARPPFAKTKFVFIGQQGLLGGMPGKVIDATTAKKRT